VEEELEPASSNGWIGVSGSLEERGGVARAGVFSVREGELEPSRGVVGEFEVACSA